MGGHRLAWSFNELRNLDLQKVYEESKQEVLREHAFKIRLDAADSLEKLKALIFQGAAGLHRWNAAELLEISNRFRLFSAPDCEIQLFEECGNDEFRAIPRAREFYLLALNKTGRLSEAVRECETLIAEGGENGLVWGILGDACSGRMLSAETFARELDNSSGRIDRVLARFKGEFARHFPGSDLSAVSSEQVRSLRHQCLERASEAYRRGFELFGTPFPGFCWMLRTGDRYADLCGQRGAGLASLHQESPAAHVKGLPADHDEEIAGLRAVREVQPALLRMALEMGGGEESLDFWTHAGYLQLYFHEGCPAEEGGALLARALDALDAEFKLEILSRDLSRIRDQFMEIPDGEWKRGLEPGERAEILDRMQAALDELAAGRERFVTCGRTRGAALNEELQGVFDRERTDPLGLFLKSTINFRTLTDTLVPQRIQGGIGRVGARMPDLIVNRQVRDDLLSLVTENILPSLSPAEQTQPKAVISAVRRLVGSRLGVAELQDLQSPAHREFDARSDGLILLSGIDPVMRIGSRSTTALSSALLLHTGDCRETMYLNGALFALYQQMQAKERLAHAMACLERGAGGEALRIACVEIPAILRYQLRGGHVAVYVDAISMDEKYKVKRLTADDPFAMGRCYGMEQLKAGLPLTRYELENAKIVVGYTDGTIRVMEPRDDATGRWRPLPHIPADGGGAPVIPQYGVHGGTLEGIRLLNLVEEHSLCFFHDSESGGIELCDGFYNEQLFDSPYAFGSGPIDTSDPLYRHGLLRAGTRRVRGPDGCVRDHQVFLEFLPFSTTDYVPCLEEGDFPRCFQLMGRLFRGELREERRRLEDGTSAVPYVMEKLGAWQLLYGTAERQRQALDQRFVRVLLELARDRPELVALEDVGRDQPLITQGRESHSVYLVLCGRFLTYKDGKLVKDHGRPLAALPGAALGEISALRDCLPTATVVGEGTVLRIAKAEFVRQMDLNPAFRESVEELVRVRLERDRLRHVQRVPGTGRIVLARRGARTRKPDE
jgi:CRP-like cAMP-binding protein